MGISGLCVCRLDVVGGIDLLSVVRTTCNVSLIETTRRWTAWSRFASGDTWQMRVRKTSSSWGRSDTSLSEEEEEEGEKGGVVNV